MENWISLLIPALLGLFFLRILILPVKWLWKLGISSLCGFLCLWMVNGISGITGLALPVNAVTVLIAGILGLPGMGLLVLLELFPK